jgi:hypothetical protein
MKRDVIVDAYCSAWNEVEPAQRDAILKPIWAEGASYADPTVLLTGRAELISHIDKVLARYPGSRIVRTSVVDAHHSVARFGWKRVLADGSSLPEGIDLVTFSEDGLILQVAGFFGPLPILIE